MEHFEVNKELEQRYIKLMEKYAESDNYGEAHGDADDALCELLTILGYGQVVVAYDEVGKYYG